MALVGCAAHREPVKLMVYFKAHARRCAGDRRRRHALPRTACAFHINTVFDGRYGAACPVMRCGHGNVAVPPDYGIAGAGVLVTKAAAAKAVTEQTAKLYGALCAEHKICGGS